MLSNLILPYQEVFKQEDFIIGQALDDGFDWAERKRQNQKYGRILYWLGDSQSDAGLKKKAGRVLDCGKDLIFDEYPDGTKKLKQVYFCKAKLCPICAKRRSMLFVNQTMAMLKAVDLAKYELRFLTLTVRNMPSAQLKQSIADIMDAYRLFRKLRSITKGLVGTIRSLEIKKASNGYDWHPHFHLLLVFEKGAPFVDHWDYVQAWRNSLRADYDPWCYIEEAFNKATGQKVRYADNYSEAVASAVAETCKYVVKPDSVFNQSEKAVVHNVATLEVALHKCRQVEYSKFFRDLRKQLKQENIDEADLLDLGDDDVPEYLTPVRQLLYSWNVGASNYLLTDVIE